MGADVPGRVERALAFVLIGVAANAAIDLGGFRSVVRSAVAWSIVVIGVVALVWPGVPRRLLDRLRGAPGWKASPPLRHLEMPDQAILVRLQPPVGHETDPSVAAEVTRPDGSIVAYDVRPPRGGPGEANTYYFTVIPAAGAPDNPY